MDEYSVKNAKTHRARRALKERESKIVENEKTAIFLKGPNCSDLVNTALHDLCKLKAPASKMFTKRNMTRPFEDQSTMEFLSKANDASLFTYGAHSKKRPHNLVFGRLFEYQILDMLEVGINPDTFRAMQNCPRSESILRVGSKPMFVFNGEGFDSNPDLMTLKNLFLDFFRGEILEKINLASLDRVIICTAIGGQVFFRHYGVVLKKSGTKFPRVELEEAGPSMDLTIRRRKEGSADLRTQAMMTHKAASKRLLAKNIEIGEFGGKAGRVHMQRQDLAKLNVKRVKGLAGKRKIEDGETGEGQSMADEGQEFAAAGGPARRSPAAGFGTNKGSQKAAGRAARRKIDPSDL